MIIEALEIHDFKGIKNLKILPGQRKLVVLSGKNGAGKSSTIEAVFTALAGGKQKLEAPVRIGADKAIIEIQLSNGAIVRKVILPEGKPALEVLSSDGAKFPQPQTLIDSWGGKLINPIEFAHATPTQRAEIFKRLTGIDNSQIDKGIAFQKTEISGLKKVLVSLEAQASTLKTDTTYPTERIDISDLLSRQEASNQERMAQQNKINHLNSLANRIEELADLYNKAQKEYQLVRADIEANPVTFVDYQEEITRAQENNALFEKGQQLQSLRKQYSETGKKILQAETVVSELEGQKERALSEAKLPLPGLGLEGESITYKGVPFEGLSSGEQLRVSLAMAIAIRGELDVMLLPNASLLDKEALELVRATAEQHGIQLWAEVVGEHDGDSIKIVDGEALYETGAGNSQEREHNFALETPGEIA